jgi:hypothetical protein
MGPRKGHSKRRCEAPKVEKSLRASRVYNYLSSSVTFCHEAEKGGTQKDDVRHQKSKNRFARNIIICVKFSSLAPKNTIVVYKMRKIAARKRAKHESTNFR